MANYKCPHNVGDRVMAIRPPGDDKFDVTKGPGWVDEMDDYVGHSHTIREIEEHDQYYCVRFEDADFFDDYAWRDDWVIKTGYTLF